MGKRRIRKSPGEFKPFEIGGFVKGEKKVGIFKRLKNILDEVFSN